MALTSGPLRPEKHRLACQDDNVPGVTSRRMKNRVSRDLANAGSQFDSWRCLPEQSPGAFYRGVVKNLKVLRNSHKNNSTSDRFVYVPQLNSSTYLSKNPSTRFLILQEIIAWGIFSGSLLIRQLKQTAIVFYSVCLPFRCPCGTKLSITLSQGGFLYL